MAGKKHAAATQYFLQHPNASISEVAKATGITPRTVASARSALAGKGLVAPGRGRGRPRIHPKPTIQPPTPEAAQILAAGASEGTPEPSETPLLDDAALRMIADPGNSLADLDLDDEATRKKLLREVKRIAFDPEAHPDTRLSATQVWLKLKDMARSRELGPGQPLTRMAAVARLKDLLSVIGLDISLDALIASFGMAQLVGALYKLLGLETPNEGIVPADPAEAARLPSGTPEEAGSPPDGPDPQG